jgi:Arc/MetJ-type ribon-helix-helix transcriptional regulator
MEAAAEGRFRDISEVMQAGLDLLRQAKAQAEAVAGMLDEMGRSRA